MALSNVVAFNHSDSRVTTRRLEGSPSSPFLFLDEIATLKMLQAFLLRHFHRHPKAIIHLDAEEKGLPTCPDGHTRFVLLSDTHTRTFKVPDGDVLIHSGDLTVTGTIEQLKMTIDWICSLPHTHKVVIAGNV